MLALFTLFNEKTHVLRKELLEVDSRLTGLESATCQVTSDILA